MFKNTALFFYAQKQKGNAEMKVIYNTGFTPITNKIIKDRKLTIYQKMVYITLCSYSNNSNISFPSYNTITEDIGCSKRKVINTIKELVDLKLIIKHEKKTKKGGNSTNVYEIVANGECHAPDSEHGSPPIAPSAPPSSASSSLDSASHAPKQYPYNKNNSFNNNHLSISDKIKIDGIIEKAELDILQEQTDIELFEEAIRKMYLSEFITVNKAYCPQITVRKQLEKINVEIIKNVFDKYSVKIPKSPLNYLISILYYELAQLDSFNLQVKRNLN